MDEARAATIIVGLTFTIGMLVVSTFLSAWVLMLVLGVFGAKVGFWQAFAAYLVTVLVFVVLRLILDLVRR